MIVDCERFGTSKVAIICCDVEVKKRVFELMNKERISHEVLGGLVKLGVKSKVMKFGVT